MKTEKHVTNIRGNTIRIMKIFCWKDMLYTLAQTWKSET